MRVFAEMILRHVPRNGKKPGGKGGKVASKTRTVSPGFFKSFRGQVLGEWTITYAVTKKVIHTWKFGVIKLLKIRIVEGCAEPSAEAGFSDHFNTLYGVDGKVLHASYRAIFSR